MAAARTSKRQGSGRLIGYAQVSTEDQGTDPQLDELRAAGCDALLEEHASGADRSRPVLARLLREIRPGETLVVVRLDRLARSVSHRSPSTWHTATAPSECADLLPRDRHALPPP